MTTRNLVPRTSGEGKLGISSKPWLEVNATNAAFTTLSITNLKNASDADLLTSGTGVSLTEANSQIVIGLDTDFLDDLGFDTTTGLNTGFTRNDGNALTVDDSFESGDSIKVAIQKLNDDLRGVAVPTIVFSHLASALVINASEGISSNDNDEALPTSAAVIDYVEAQLTLSDLDFQGDTGGTLSIDLDSEVLDIAGGTGISTVGSDNTLTINLDDTAVSAGNYGGVAAIPVLSIDAQGRITNASTSSVTITSSSVSDFTEVVQDIAGAQLATNGSHTGITATYDDANDGAIDLTIADAGVTHDKLHDNIISSQNAMTDDADKLASTDLILVSDTSATSGDGGGAEVKKATLTQLEAYMQANLAFTNDTNSDVDVTVANLETRLAEVGAITLGADTNSTVTIPGNLIVNGSQTQQNVTTIQVKDPIMQLNYEDGSALTGANSGIHVGRNGTTDASLIFDEVSGDVWKAGLAGAEIALVDISSTQTLTGKTLTSPKITDLNIHDTTITFEGDNDDDHSLVLQVTEPTTSRTLTLPDATDTLVGKATTDTLTNKTLSGATLSGTIAGTPTFSGIGTHSALDIFNAGISVKNGATSAGFIEFFEDSGNGTNKATLIGPASTDDVTLTLPAATDTLVGKATTDTLTNKTLSDATLSGTIAGTPTFSGIGTHSALDIFNAGITIKNGNSSAGFIELFEKSDQGTNKTTLIGANEVGTSDITLTLPAATDTLVGKATTDTLTNKTLSGATLSGTIAGTPTFSGVGTHSGLDIFSAGISVKNGNTSAGFIEFFEDSDNGSNKVTLIGPASTSDVTLTLPAATDTLVGKATTDTLTNKTLTNPNINAAALSGTLSGTPTFSDVVTHSALDVFDAGISVKNGDTSAGFIEFFEDSNNGSNKATLIGPAATSDVILTLPAATDTLVGKATTDTLTNKTLTNPSIDGAALSGTLSGTPTFSGNISFSGSNTFENSTGQIIQGAEAGAGILYIKADQGDDDGDTWKFNVADGGVLTVGNNKSGSDVSHLTMTPHATVGNSVAQFHGDLTIDGDLTVSGDTITQNVTTVTVQDPIMQINYSGATAGALQDSGIHVGRTGEDDASLIWDHSISKWAAGLKDAEVELVDISSSQTLTNKTLTNPSINAAALSGTLSGTPTFSGVGTHSALDIFNAGISVKNGETSAGFIELYEDGSNGSNKATLIGPASTADVTLTLPSATDTLVGKATTDTLTNKTLSDATLSGTMAGTPTFSGVGTHSALDIFNAGISVKNGETSAGFIELYEDGSNGSNKATLIGPASTADVTVTLPAATDTLVGKATTDTLTNKTLTSPVINTGVSGTAISTSTTMGGGGASDTILSSQLAIKTYVDAQVGGGDLDFACDTGGDLAVDLDEHKLTVSGGSGIDTAGSGSTDKTISIALNLNSLTEAPVDIAADSIVFIDSDDSNKKETMADFISAVAGDGLVQNNTSKALEVKVDDSTIELNSDTLRIKNSGVTLPKMADLANLKVIGNLSGGTATPSAIEVDTNLNSVSSSDDTLASAKAIRTYVEGKVGRFGGIFKTDSADNGKQISTTRATNLGIDYDYTRDVIFDSSPLVRSHFGPFAYDLGQLITDPWPGGSDIIFYGATGSGSSDRHCLVISVTDLDDTTYGAEQTVAGHCLFTGAHEETP